MSELRKSKINRPRTSGKFSARTMYDISYCPTSGGNCGMYPVVSVSTWNRTLSDLLKNASNERVPPAAMLTLGKRVAAHLNSIVYRGIFVDGS